MTEYPVACRLEDLDYSWRQVASPGTNRTGRRVWDWAMPGREEAMIRNELLPKGEATLMHARVGDQLVLVARRIRPEFQKFFRVQAWAAYDPVEDFSLRAKLRAA